MGKVDLSSLKIIQTKNGNVLRGLKKSEPSFKGLSEENILLNIASIEHDPAESITCNLDDIYYEW